MILLIEIDPGGDRPIYAQIVDRVKYGVASGVVRPGDLVPSVRELSRRLVVNPNTVARAYRELQQQGVLETVRGTGLQVAGVAPSQCVEERRALVRARLRAALEEARRSELPSGEIETVLRQLWDEIFTSPNDGQTSGRSS